jgi:hypothetical protein
MQAVGVTKPISQKNETLEMIKLFASYMVVFIHVPFWGAIGETVNSLARFAVPLFFVVAGFFSYGASLAKIKKRCLHILSLHGFAFLLYTAINVVIGAVQHGGQGVVTYFAQYLDLATLVRLLLCNLPVSCSRMWYLLAMVYVYGIYYVAIRFGVKEKLIFVVSFLLMISHLILEEGLCLFGVDVDLLLVRNFLFTGIPFFGLGLFVRKYQKRIYKTPVGVVGLCFAAGVALTLLSKNRLGLQEVYLGSLLILFAMIWVFVRYAEKTYPTFLVGLAGLSTYIYIFHTFVAMVFSLVYLLAKIDGSHSFVLQMVNPLLVALVTTAVSFGWVQLIFRWKTKKI